MDDRALLEGIVRAESGDREDPAAVALYEHVSARADPLLAREIAWHLSFQAARRNGRLTCVGPRVRALIADYPACGGPDAPEGLLAQLAIAAPADVYEWLCDALQGRLGDREAIEAELLGFGWSALELDAAQVAVRLPFGYFGRRARLGEEQRETAIRSYALEQGMLI